MTQSAYYQRVKVDAYCFVTSSLPGIYKSLTDYCNNSSIKKLKGRDAKFLSSKSCGKSPALHKLLFNRHLKKLTAQ
jgi:hypothetical protein